MAMRRGQPCYARGLERSREEPAGISRATGAGLESMIEDRSMTPSRGPALAPAALLLLVAVSGLAPARQRSTTATPGACRQARPWQIARSTPTYSDLFVPALWSDFRLPFPAVETMPAPSRTATPTATRTATRLPTRTPTASHTPGPSPTPTRRGGFVAHPTDPATIILQVGWSDSEQPGAAWEEMNGTPFFTLYGDGELIAGPRLFDWEHKLLAGRVDEEQIQAWLQHLTYEVGFFRLAERYEHPNQATFAVHVYVRFGDRPRDFGRVSLAGYPLWLQEPLPPGEQAEQAGALARFVQRLEAFAASTLRNSYEPASYTVISHEIYGLLAAPPTWSHPLDIVAISDRAPLRPIGGNVRGPPGHQIVDASLGRELQAIVTADARRYWPGLNLAAEYVARRRRFVVGIRPEVPGESPFLPDSLREVWYRRDGLHHLAAGLGARRLDRIVRAGGPLLAPTELLAQDTWPSRR